MQTVPARQIEAWLADGRILEQDGRGPKVVALADGRFLKIFHTRRHPVLARLQPAARRFARNAERLRQLGIPAPAVGELFWVDRPSGLSACLYEPLPGESVESLVRQDPDHAQRLLTPLAEFIRTLHRLGIYFRSLHLGNILLLPDGRFGLIDVLDLRFKHAPLGPWLVRRNLQHLDNYLQRSKLQGFSMDELLTHYRGD